MAKPAATRVILLGLMGSGKTTAGSLLAERTGWPALDNDVLLSKITGKTLTEVAELGADQLHDAERDILLHVLKMPPPFVAGAAAAVIEYPEVIPALHHGAFAVYLHVPPELLVMRIGDDADRPWLKPDPLAALTAMYDARDALYRKAAAYVVDGTLPPDQVADRIYAELPRPL
jgi:shikimate kinase